MDEISIGNVDVESASFSVEGHRQYGNGDTRNISCDDDENEMQDELKTKRPSLTITNGSISFNQKAIMAPQQIYPRQPSESSPLYPVSVSDQGCCWNCFSLTKKAFKSAFQLFFPSYIFVKFFIHAIIPQLADNLVPLFFIGNVPNESALALAGQFTFVSVIVEVIQEGIVNSLFYFVGKNYNSNREKSLQALKLCLVILLALGSILTVLMMVLTPQFVNLIDTPASIAEATKHFLYTSSFSFPLILVSAALSNYLLITTSSYLVLAQLSSVMLSVLCNFFLFGGQRFSLHWNVEQLGYYKIIQSFLSCTNGLLFCLIIEKRGPLEFMFKIPLTHDLKHNFKDLFHVSWGNFGDSAVRNFFYFMVTLKFINNLGETEVAAWNLMNSIVWGLLLIPSFTVANYAKVKIGHHGSKATIRNIANESFKCLTCWLVVVALLTYFLWPNLANFFGKSNADAQKLSIKMIREMGWIFIFFSFNNAMDSLFIGVGKTQYVFYQSLVTNLVIYFIPWVLYLSKTIQPTYWLVIGLYISGMLVDFSLTVYFSFRVWKTIPNF